MTFWELFLYLWSVKYTRSCYSVLSEHIFAYPIRSLQHNDPLHIKSPSTRWYFPKEYYFFISHGCAYVLEYDLLSHCNQTKEHHFLMYTEHANITHSRKIMDVSVCNRRCSISFKFRMAIKFLWSRDKNAKEPSIFKCH